MAKRTQEFQTIHSEGGLLPTDLLRRVIDPKADLPGTKPEDYGLPQGERINETITQSWNRLCRHWAEFREAAKRLPEGEAGTGLTNDKWGVPLLRELGFGMVPTSAGPEINGKTYAINRFFGPTAIHLIGCGLNLDRRTAGAAGAAKSNPHGLVQEFLNRSQGHLWAILSNGHRLRILRDSQALSRQSYLEFDLEAMFDGEVFSDFVLLWLMGHATRFAVRENDRPESCWLEQWTKIADEQGTRALESLKGGVERALVVLGQGFVGHPHNTALRESLRSGNLSLSDFHGQLLRVVYRLIFLFVAEDRTLDGVSLIHPPDNTEKGRLARERFSDHYSTSRLRELASKIKGSRHGDLWQQFNVLVGALYGDERFESAREQLALPIFGSFLWNPASTKGLNAASLSGADGAELTNFDFLETLRNLAITKQGKTLRLVDYKNIGAEEIGGVYESLLALTPQISGDGSRFSFAEFAGNERKTSGSYYTPDSLVQCLLDSALDPVVEEAIKGKNATESEKALLALKVCDPAVGSGHFLVGAAHRLARHLARVRAVAQGESEPSPVMYQRALRDVIGRCLYGVDISQMAVELCKVSLWMEAIEPGKPLSFLEHRIKCGNSLLGTTPALLAQGIPDEAFIPIEGDDKKYCAMYKKANKQERESKQRQLLPLDNMPWNRLGDLPAAFQEVDNISDDKITGIVEKQKRYEELVHSASYEISRLWADAWCASFVWKKTKEFAYPITEEVLRNIEHNPHSIPQWMKAEVIRLSEQYQFLHWHIAFPDVFRVPSKSEDPNNADTGWIGGFDVILGNPPWGQIQFEPEEFFAETAPQIASAANMTVRDRMIRKLRDEDPQLYSLYAAEIRWLQSYQAFIHASGRFPTTSYGRLNTAPLFAEVSRSIVKSSSRIGLIVPSGIATDSFNQYFFQKVVDSNSLYSLFSFENEEFIFPGIHHATKFCLFTFGGNYGSTASKSDFTFFARSTGHLREPERRFQLRAEEIALLNPNTRTCPIFRFRRDAELTKAIHRRVPVFISENPPESNSWRVRYQLMFMMNTDSHRFKTSEQLRSDGWRLDVNTFRHDEGSYLPLYEGKMIHHFDHRWGTYYGQSAAQANQGKLPELDSTMHADPGFLPLPRYWTSESDVAERLAGVWQRNWLLAWRDVTSVVVYRTVIAAIIPRSGVGHTSPLIFPSSVDIRLCSSLLANLSSFVLDYSARQKIGGSHLTYGYLNQLPVMMPTAFQESWTFLADGESPCSWVGYRTLELTYSAFDLGPFAKDFGWFGPPFRWDEERRFIIRCELDAAFFHLYLPADAASDWKPARVSEGAVRDETPEVLNELKKHFPTPRHAVEYIMETFPIVKRKDEEKYGEYRTKRIILEIYDEMAEAMRTGKPYQTRLDPPPGPPTNPDGTFAKLPDWPNGSPKPANWPPHIHEPRRDRCIM